MQSNWCQGVSGVKCHQWKEGGVPRGISFEMLIAHKVATNNYKTCNYDLCQPLLYISAGLHSCCYWMTGIDQTWYIRDIFIYVCVVDSGWWTYLTSYNYHYYYLSHYWYVKILWVVLPLTDRIYAIWWRWGDPKHQNQLTCSGVPPL